MKFLSKYDKLYFISIMFLFVGCVAAMTFGIIIMSKFSSKSSSNKAEATADGFTIEQYKIVLNVKENNSIDVKEYISVNFYETGHHGIYRFIPVYLEYTSKNNKTLSKRANITNLTSYDNNYSVISLNGKKQIKMGDDNKTLPIGVHNYTIGYTYDMGEDPYYDYDEFIFHAFGDFWNTRINNASVEINFPKSFDINKIHFFADKYRKKDITSFVNYTVLGNTVYANVSPDYSLNKSLTIDIELPDGYFINSNDNYGYISLFFCVICVVFAINAAFLWIKDGKDLYKIPDTIEPLPPEQFDAAQIGYLYKKDTGKRLTIALIIELASKGFIKIIESEDKKTITIMKNDQFSNTVKMTVNEELVYNQLFEEGDQTVLLENKSFYKVFNKVSDSVRSQFDDKINDLSSYRSMEISSFEFAVSIILWGLAYCVIEDMNSKFHLMYSLGALSVMITFFFSIVMKRKNSYGEKITSRVNGFKKYIQYAEKEQIDKFAKDNPMYFYDILPYAYVLNVSKKWIDKFEKIPKPLSDIGNFDYWSTDSLNDLSNSVFSPGSSSSGGCSSCGGGCSSCGGGGSW